MDPLRNPYAPGAGTPPPALRGRDGELEAFRILLERLRQGRSEKSLLVSGLRGVGKTVLLNAFASIARSENFITAASEITHETNFRALMARRTQRALGEISPARRPSPALAQACRSFPRGPWRRNPTPNASSTSQRLEPCRPKRPGRRCACPPGKKGADFENAAVENILSFTEGYPYFLQLYGRYVWDKAAGPTITLADTKAVLKSVQDQLDDSFFSVRMERCTKTELAYLRAMGTLGKGPHQSGAIASALGRDTSSDLGAIRAKLIEKGLIYSAAWGQNDFTVPHFADFLRRNYPREE